MRRMPIARRYSALVEDKAFANTVMARIEAEWERTRAAVLAIALFVITLGFTVVQMRTLERRVHYAR